MKRTTWAGLAAAVTLLTVAPLSAQEYRGDVALNGGYAFFTKSVTDSDIPGGLSDDIGFAPNGVIGLQADAWLTPRWGVRLDLGYTSGFLRQGDAENYDLEDINMWDAAVDGVYRFMGPNPGEFLGLEVLPYLAAGIGVKNMNVPGDQELSPMPIAHTPTGGLPDTILFKSTTKFEGRVALGADFRVMPMLAIRAEIGDIMFKPEIQYAPTGDDVSKLTHEFYGTLGLAVPFGFITPPPVAVAPPPPAPAPAPPPAPREENVSVCVIDPTADVGVRSVDAIYLVDQGDTVVVQNGNRVPINTAYGNVVVAPNQDWYVAGQPLVFNVDNRRTEFVSYGGARVIPSGSLAFLGYQNGIAVYADAGDVAAVQDAWNDMRQAQGTGDISAGLAARKDLADAFRNIEFLYVPMQPVGCVFQALQRVEEVRKGAKQ